MASFYTITVEIPVTADFAEQADVAGKVSAEVNALRTAAAALDGKTITCIVTKRGPDTKPRTRKPLLVKGEAA